MAESWTGPRVQWVHRPTDRRGRAVVRRGIAERERALARAPLFAGLSSRDRRAIARAAGIVRYREDTPVVKEGASGSVFFVILEGKAKVIRKGRTLSRLRRGDFFGEMSLLDGEPRTASVITEAPSTFLTLAASDFHRVLDREPKLGLRMLQVMAGRLRARERPLVG
ncbi:MAG: cyclic nucleotide-binding domain-containing protein [Actinomycetota bacterium]